MAVTFEDRKASVTIVRSWDGTGADPGGAQATVSHPGMSVVTIQVVGALNLTLIPEATTDEATFVALNAVNLNSGVKAQTITAAGLYRVDVAGARVFRVRCSPYTSGSPVVTLNAGFASTDASSTSSGTGTGSTQVQGTAASGAALSGNPVRQGMSDGTLVQDILSANAATGAVGNVAGVAGAALMGWHNPTYTRIDSSALIGLDGWVNTHELLMVASLGGVYNGSTADRMRAANTAAGTTGTGLTGVGPLVWDGTNWQKAVGDTSGRPYVTGPAAVGAAVAGNPVYIAVKDAAGNVQSPLIGLAGTSSVSNASVLLAQMGISQGAAVIAPLKAASNVSDTDSGVQTASVAGYLYNLGSFDRARNNVEVIIQASGVTTVQTINTDIVTYNAEHLAIHLNVTLYNGGTLTCKLQWKDANGLFVDIPLATTGGLTSGADILMVLGKGTWPANTATAFYTNFVLPRQVRIVQTIATASITYSAAYTLNV